jgi:uncharacterized protein (DUF433 family)
MNAADTLKETELAIAALPGAEKKKLFRRLARQFDSAGLGIEQREGVMGGVACIRNTRIPVWVLFQARRQNVSEADLLKNYPGLTAEDLVNAWDYASINRDEIELQIKENELED